MQVDGCASLSRTDQAVAVAMRFAVVGSPTGQSDRTRASLGRAISLPVRRGDPCGRPTGVTCRDHPDGPSGSPRHVPVVGLVLVWFGPKRAPTRGAPTGFESEAGPVPIWFNLRRESETVNQHSIAVKIPEANLLNVESLCALMDQSRSLRGRNDRSEKVENRGQIFTILRCIVVLFAEKSHEYGPILRFRSRLISAAQAPRRGRIE